MSCCGGMSDAPASSTSGGPTPNSNVGTFNQNSMAGGDWKNWLLLAGVGVGSFIAGKKMKKKRK